MEKIFEDEFMDLQAEYVSLCLELFEDRADEIFIYVANEEDVKSFNAFCKVGGEVKTLHEMSFDTSLIFQFLEIGTDDVERFNKLCDKYNMPAPRELKMHYYVRTRKFEAKYKYEPVCSSKMKAHTQDIFEAWVQEIKDQG